MVYCTFYACFFITVVDADILLYHFGYIQQPPVGGSCIGHGFAEEIDFCFSVVILFKEYMVVTYLIGMTQKA